jgi:hypothetical protein
VDIMLHSIRAWTVAVGNRASTSCPLAMLPEEPIHDMLRVPTVTTAMTDDQCIVEGIWAMFDIRPWVVDIWIREGIMKLFRRAHLLILLPLPVPRSLPHQA